MKDLYEIRIHRYGSGNCEHFRKEAVSPEEAVALVLENQPPNISSVEARRETTHEVVYGEDWKHYSIPATKRWFPTNEPPETPPLDPKGSAGAAKPQLQLIPPELNFHLAGAIALGAKKYGPWNWRTAKVESMTYVGAIRRHLDAYLDGEETDPESGVHHLGHVAACCAIVLDARKHGTLADNRPRARAQPAGDV